MKFQVEKIENYKGLGNALRLYDDVKEAIVTLDVGPRIMHVSLLGKPSVIEDSCPMAPEKLPDGKEWHIYGGHRTWHSPEAYPRSYMSDSEPLESYTLLDDGIRMVQKQEPWTQIQKAMELHFTNKGFRVVNSMTNNNAWTIEMAVWALTVGSRSGREVCPVVQRNTGLQTNTGYRSWPYSRMDDPRVHWGRLYVVVDNDPEDTSAFKFGYGNEAGWIAYFNHDQCFVKKFAYQRGANYPDMGSSYQTYTSFWGVELESLSPLQFVKPGKTITHEEEWFVVESKGLPTYDEAEISAKLAPIAAVTGIEIPVPNDEPWDPTFDEGE